MMMQEVSDHNAEIYVNEPFDFEKSHFNTYLIAETFNRNRLSEFCSFCYTISPEPLACTLKSKLIVTF